MNEDPVELLILAALNDPVLAEALLALLSLSLVALRIDAGLPPVDPPPLEQLEDWRQRAHIPGAVGLLIGVHARFGEVPEPVERRVLAADPEQLERWTRQLATEEGLRTFLERGPEDA